MSFFGALIFSTLYSILMNDVLFYCRNGGLKRGDQLLSVNGVVRS